MRKWFSWLFNKSHQLPSTYGSKVKGILDGEIDLRKLYNSYSTFVFPNPREYQTELESIMQQDILRNELRLTLVPENKMVTISYLDFLGSGGRIPTDPIGDLKLFISVLDRFNNYYNLYANIKGNITLSVNLRYIQIHIIYIRKIIDTVYLSVKTN
jgi:hypothetical protein|nr:MAG TPA: hypothetical protein [Caudoviricetes sp.]